MAQLCVKKDNVKQFQQAGGSFSNRGVILDRGRGPISALSCPYAFVRFLENGN